MAPCGSNRIAFFHDPFLSFAGNTANRLTRAQVYEVERETELPYLRARILGFNESDQIPVEKSKGFHLNDFRTCLYL